MIELSQGRSVKWQHNGRWFTGYVLDNEANAVKTLQVHTWLVLVRHSNTHKVFIVKASELQDNDFRKEEKRMEVAKCES